MKMGTKSKKLNKTQESHLPISDEGKLQLEKGGFPSETNNSTHSVKKSKKNRKLDLNGSVVEDTPAQIKSEEIDESNTPADGEMKKKKKKMRELHNEVLNEEVQNDSGNNLNADEVHIPKKKKKKNKVLKEDVKLELDEVPEMESHKVQKDSKKKKNKNSSANEVQNEEDIIPKIENTETKKKSKAKRGAPSLNDEEAQVTEEDIDKFIDELSEEDNKQYEDWVKLLDARLSKKTKAE